jgi:tetratricopeptide (TPR) repeat protein
MRETNTLAAFHHNMGAALFSKGRYAESLAMYNEALQHDPDFVLSFTGRGNAYTALGRHAEALIDHNRAIQIDPDFALGYYNRGVTYAFMGKSAEALTDYNHALQLDSNLEDGNLEEAYCNRGVAYAELGQHEDALADFNRAIQLNPNDADAHFNIGSGYYRTNQLKQALPYFDKAAALGHPKGAQAAALVRRKLGGGPDYLTDLMK